MTICAATTAKGNPCTAASLGGSDRCWFHSKERRAERLLASSKGGRSHSNGLDIQAVLSLAEILSGDPAALQALLRGLAVGVVQGKVERATLTGCTYAVGQMAKLWEAVELEDRLRRIEEKLGIGT